MLSPVGNTVKDSWDNIVAGKSGISKIEHFDTTNYSSKIAGLVKDFDGEQFGITKKDGRKMDMFIQYGIAASLMALEDSGLQITEENAPRIGTAIGSGIGGLGLIEQNIEALIEGGPRKISPFFVPSTIINMVSGHVSIRTGARGPNIATVTACSSGTHAIGLSARLIQYGDADVMICGGAEKASTPMGIGGFCALKALSTRNDEPEKASRPWDEARDGFVLGDGAGVLVLEELEHAKARGAKIYAEVAGFGMSSDAFHMTAPPDDGSGAALAMANAIKDAGIKPEEVQYYNAHGTSTPVNDPAETAMIKKAFGDHAYKMKVSSTKSMTGHCLGAAGAIEAMICVKAIEEGVYPPTINLENVDTEHGCDLDYVPNKAVVAEGGINCAASGSLGFGGHNGVVIFKK